MYGLRRNSLDSDGDAAVWLPARGIAERLSEPHIKRVRQTNDVSWNDPRHWWMGHYFGPADTRLWVPKMMRNGKEHPTKRIINFCHPEGRQAFLVLVVAYVVGLLSLAIVLSIVFGARW